MQQHKISSLFLLDFDLRLLMRSLSCTHWQAGNRNESQVFPEEEHYEFVSCWQGYWFMRTMFQAFGEFYLEEMTNNWAVAFAIITFFFMNVRRVCVLLCISVH